MPERVNAWRRRSAGRCLATIVVLLIASGWARVHGIHHASAASCAACQVAQPMAGPAPPSVDPPHLRCLGLAIDGAPPPAAAIAIEPCGRGPPGRA